MFDSVKKFFNKLFGKESPENKMAETKSTATTSSVNTKTTTSSDTETAGKGISKPTAEAMQTSNQQSRQ